MDNSSSKHTSAMGNEHDSTATTTTDRNTNSGPTTIGGQSEVEAESPRTGSPSGRPATDEETRSGAATSRGLAEVGTESPHAGSPSGAHPQFETGNAWVLARVTSKEREDFEVRTVVGEATISVSEEVVGIALDLELVLKLDTQIQIKFVANTNIPSREDEAGKKKIQTSLSLRQALLFYRL